MHCLGNRHLLKILSYNLAKVHCLGDRHLEPCKVESYRHRKHKVPQWISVDDGECGPSYLPLGFRTQVLSADWLYIQPLTERAFYTLEDSTPASEAA